MVLNCYLDCKLYRLLLDVRLLPSNFRYVNVRFPHWMEHAWSNVIGCGVSGDCSAVVQVLHASSLKRTVPVEHLVPTCVGHND